MKKVTYSTTIDGRHIHVLDDVLDERQIADIGDRFTRASFIRDESDGPGKEHVRTFNTDLELADFEGTPVAERAKSAVDSFFPERKLSLYRAHCNLTVYGDMGFPHQDCASDRDDVTALLFANAEWRTEWGGELTFYNAADDAVYVVTPRPGRLLVFEGAVPHRVGIPLRACYEPRLTLACKFKTPGTWR
ncbi:2OG-Fe(II) oxygenase [Streptomyces anulatus]|uniref:Fe2OG dioxygenase domain-containing protein n=1 Tax=Streptomyces anulatus TaxID=1892 RepID=A0A7K3R7G8_STRAQ|nr:2OG-Fe(II) oxygenase [Streptomyces anulatus]NEB98124.1 hypothetical protein [Streptomyces anulatus]NED24735.1 hypothetical protein [Streptomyces anulatus]